MNPLDHDRFWRLWEDVDGLLDFTVGPLAGALSHHLPDYVTVLQHGGSRRRPLDVDLVAIPLFEILRVRKDGSYGPRFRSAQELRHYFKLGASTKLLFTGVDDDRRIERFWFEHKVNKVAEEIAALDPIGVTTPNFSFFTDATRFQILRNRKRILLAAEYFSAAGVPVVPHLNAATPADWDFWAGFLREHSEISVVSKEFQTGLSAVELGRRALAELARLQERLDRPLHPVLFAGGRHYLEARQIFQRFTIVDSRPLMEALARNTLQESNPEDFTWTHRPTMEGEPIDDLFEASLRAYPQKLAAASLTDRPRPTIECEGQLTFDLQISMPYLTAQPAA